MMDEFNHKKVDVKILTQNKDCEHRDTCFYNKKVVFTGDLNGWDRPTAASLLQLLGADVNTSISRKTDIVVIGPGAGPAKLEKIIDLLADGVCITLMNERIFNRETEAYRFLLNIS